MERRRKWYRRILIGFFLFMLAGTLVSRIYDSMTVPKVLTAYSKRKSVETMISGTGTVKERETVLCDIFPGLKVESVSVAAGSEVKTGDELFHFQMESVLEQQAELEGELERAKLNLERRDIASETYASVTQAELAQRELTLAQQALAEGQKEYDEKWAEHFVNKKNLEEEYRKNKALSDDELLLSQEQQLASAEKELRNAKASRDGQIREAQQEIDELKAKIEAAKSGSPVLPTATGSNASAGTNAVSESSAVPEINAVPEISTVSETSAVPEINAVPEISTVSETSASSESDASAETDIAALEKQLAAAQQELSELKGQWDLTISEIRYRHNTLSLQYDKLVNGETSAQQALKDTYEAEIKQEDEAAKAEEEELETLKKNVENAQWNLDIASRQDKQAALSAGQQARLAEIDRQLQQAEIRELERRLERIGEVVAEEGRVCAEADGTVILQEMTAGRTSTGEERLSIATGSRVFEAEFDKEGQELSVGDLLAVSIPGSARSVEARIGSMNLLGEESGIFRADLEDLNLAVGTVTSYQCRRTSDTYQNVIPLSALRRDSEGYYCLAVRTRSAVMGQEFRAERVGLTVLEMGSTEAAVEGAIFDTDPLITASNQVVISGDRVRPVEDLQG